MEFRRVRPFALSVALALTALLAIAPSSAARGATRHPSPRRLGGVCGIYSNRTTVWALDCIASAITVVSATTGKIERVIRGPQYDWTGDMTGSVSNGTDTWVGDSNNRITELSNRTGALVRIIVGQRYQFDSPAVSLIGGDLWVGNIDSVTVTEIKAATGALVHVFAGRKYHFYQPGQIVALDGNLWVSSGSNQVTEMTPTGTVLRVVTATRHLDCPCSLGTAGSNVWIVNYSSASISVVSAVTGKLVRVIAGSNTGLFFPFWMTQWGNLTWVANAYSVTELNTATDRVIRVLQGPFPERLDDVYDDGVHLWVGTATALYEFRNTDGRLVRVVQ